jgi:RNA polymerase sigma-70 factor (ECF subfamily)
MHELVTVYSESELLEMLNGDKPEADRAFRIIYDRYSSRIHAYCMRILNDRSQAEDIFQETFIKFYRRVNTEKLSDGSIAGFLITIARNLCLNYKRDKKSTVPIEEYHLVLSADEINENQENYKLITMAIELLPIEYREPLVLRLYDGLSYDEISDICNITVENARKRVFRAKQKIKEILQPYYREISQ